MKKTIFIILSLLSVNVLAQQVQSDANLARKVKEQSQKIEKQRKQLNRQESSIRILKKEKVQLEKQQNQLAQNLTQQESRLDQLAHKQDDFSIQLKHKEIENQNAFNKVNQELTQKVNKESLETINKTQQDFKSFLVIGVILLLILFLTTYYWLSRRLNKIQLKVKDIDNISLSNKENTDISDKLFILLEKHANATEPSSNTMKAEEVDHSLALKVADEIVRINKNISNMDPKTKGLKQLTASIKRIQDNFLANGYELVDMLGKDYHEGMNLSANFVTSYEIETGKQIITRIIKPQVNYNGKMIQSAQIEVTIGE